MSQLQLQGQDEARPLLRPQRFMEQPTRNPTLWKRSHQVRFGVRWVHMTVKVAAFCLLLVPCQSLTASSFNETQRLEGSSSLTGRTQGGKNVCLTEGCIHAASQLLELMDLKANPCDDFYQFACGSFSKQAIPEYAYRISSSPTVPYALQIKLKSVFTRPVTPNDTKPFVLAKQLYSACMNETAIEEAGTVRALDLLDQAGGWPVLKGDDWDERSFNWRQLTYKFRKNGIAVDSLISFGISIDLKNSTNHIIQVGEASLGVDRKYLIEGFDNKLVKAYYSYMVDIAVLFGAERERAQRELRESLDFEMQLANISLPVEQMRNYTKLYNPMTIEEMERRFPTIPWLEYLNNVLSSPKIQLTSSEVVIVSVPNYFADLEKLLSHTPKRVVANYLMWREASDQVSYLPQAFQNREFKYITAASGVAERSPRWEECLAVVSTSLYLVTGALYVRNFFEEEAKKVAGDMVQGIIDEMNQILVQIDWLDENTRKNALEKASSITTHIAYPDELLDDTKLSEFYEDLNLSNESYFDAIMNIKRFYVEYHFNHLRKAVNKSDWITRHSPVEVNAFYNRQENSIQLTAGILQGIYFSNDRPKYMNYGAIGSMIGHEVVHGFDDQGRQFDKNGNLVDWWAPETKSKYLEKTQCLIWQYGNYTHKQVNMSLNGINTQGENIADLGGMKLTYRAYKEWAKKHGPEPLIPGFQNFTPEQMIWINAASIWCSVMRNEVLATLITTNPHSPDEFRVRGPLSNLEEFSRDFNCPLGSSMNPVQKCQVW